MNVAQIVPTFVFEMGIQCPHIRQFHGHEVLIRSYFLVEQGLEVLNHNLESPTSLHVIIWSAQKQHRNESVSSQCTYTISAFHCPHGENDTSCADPEVRIVMRAKFIVNQIQGHFRRLLQLRNVGLFRKNACFTEVWSAFTRWTKEKPCHKRPRPSGFEFAVDVILQISAEEAGRTEVLPIHE